MFTALACVGKLAHKYGKTFIVDAMSSFGGVPLDLEEAKISYIVSSANKCLEGIPGFSFILMRKVGSVPARQGKARQAQTRSGETDHADRGR